MTIEELAYKLVKTNCPHGYGIGLLRVHCPACATEAIKNFTDLQVSELKELLGAVYRGEACGPDCAGSGSVGCYGCDDRIRKALGMKPRI